ncbi:sulfonate transport system substrate-binding protein [Azotobacter beijerinckii]|uniref:Putative aliphatic sulfonates-binding protein n=1 Tax=Azotobacter beijerinckii TaxID=170623 RepID=A0A1H6YF94_9GAMM|nr:ABC transporter substrate-binding protein [Azotobacter beijerinckii]SEJ39146.1 sulfonate transport system substrate-binding protein [Azotobacter beijerinckii]
MPNEYPSMTRRRVLLAGSVLAGAALASRWGVAASGPLDLSRTRLGVGTYKGAAPSFLEEAGLAPPPYEVSYAELAGGNLIVEALAGGSLDVGSMSEIPPVFAIQSQAPIKLIAVLRGDVNNQVFLVPQGSGVREIAELRGKRVGFVRSTTSHYFLIKALKEQGLSLADIEPVGLTPQDGFSAFQSGQLDAWVIYGIYIQIALARTHARIVKTALGYLSGNYVIAARAESLKDPYRVAAIKDYLAREQQVWDWVQANPESWAKKSAAITGIDASLFMDQFRARSEPYRMVPVDDAAIRSQQEVADLFYEAGVLRQRLDVAPLWARGVWP